MEDAEIKEVSVDQVGEKAQEKIKEDRREIRWMRWLALTTAVFAVLAAIASLESGKLANDALLHMNEATLKQAQASDQWAYYQAKGIEQVTREVAADILTASKAAPDVITSSRDEAQRYKAKQEEIRKEATRLEQEQKELQNRSQEDLHHHHTFAYVVTVLQVAIGLSAIAALVERRSVWLFALAIGIVGMVMMALGLIHLN
jgi:hypothetical protein